MNQNSKLFPRGVIRCGMLTVFLLASAGASDAQEKQAIEKQVRAMIVSEIETQELKVKSIEAELNLAKKQLRERKANLEAIVAAHVASMLQNEVAPAPDDSLKGESAEELGGIGWQLWRERKLVEALPKFRKAVSLNPDNSNLWNGLGWTQMQLGDSKNAAESFKRALKLDSQHGGAKNGLGQSYIGLNKLDLAEKELVQATEDAIKSMGEKNAVDAAAWYVLVRLYITKNDKEKAIQWAERLLKQKPDEPNMKELLDQAKLLPDKAE